MGQAKLRTQVNFRIAMQNAARWLLYIVVSFIVLWIAEAAVLFGLLALGIQQLFSNIITFIPEAIFGAGVAAVASFALSGWLTDRLGPTPLSIVVLAIPFVLYQGLTLEAMISAGETNMVFVSVGSAVGLIVQAVARSMRQMHSCQ